MALHCSACLQVVAIAKDVLQIVADKKGYSFTFTEHLFGGCSIDAHGDPLTTETLEACRAVSVLELSDKCLELGVRTPCPNHWAVLDALAYLVLSMLHRRPVHYL